MKRTRGKESLAFYLFISPWFLVFVCLGLVPLLWGLYLSFTNFTGFNLDRLRLIGFGNYMRVLQDDDAMYSIGRTLLITILVVPATTLISYLLAALLNKSFRGVGLFRTLFYLPAIIPVVAVGLIWKLIYNSQDGLLNSLLSGLGLSPVEWLGYDLITTSFIIMLLWGAGGGLLTFLAALKGIPHELYESASIDGASLFQKFRSVTTPMMTPIIFFNLIMGVIQTLQIMIRPVLLAPDKGAGLLNVPIRPIYLFPVHAMQQIFVYQRFAYGLAMLWLLFVIILVATLVIFYTSRYWVHYEVDQEGN